MSTLIQPKLSKLQKLRARTSPLNTYEKKRGDGCVVCRLLGATIEFHFAVDYFFRFSFPLMILSRFDPRVQIL